MGELGQFDTKGVREFFSVWFDNWLEKHDREIRAQAWDEGWEAAGDEGDERAVFASNAPNPYRTNT